MNPKILNRLQVLNERYQELQLLLSDADTISDQAKFKSLSQEYSKLENIVNTYQTYQKLQNDLLQAQELLNDPDFKEIAKLEIAECNSALEEVNHNLQILLLPTDPNDEYNVFLEIRAGTGGSEAGIFAGDLYRMYTRFAEIKGWRVEQISSNESEQGGFKEIIVKISGDLVYGNLKFESGGHRVQRVPKTESQGRIHTSACTVAVMPELPESEIPEINPADLRIDTFRASGAGGQHVNKTDSAVRITHLPTGLVVECQDDRSQHKNKARAMSVLASRLAQAEAEKQAAEKAETRRNLLGSGDRSDKIRTYNYPQGRVTDHRINLTLYRIDDIMNGKLDELVTPIIQAHQADQLANLENS